MLELLETFLTTISLWHVVEQLEALTVTDMTVIFLLSKPLFVFIALGAVFAGRHWGEDHYLHSCASSTGRPHPRSRTN